MFTSPWSNVSKDTSLCCRLMILRVHRDQRGAGGHAGLAWLSMAARCARAAFQIQIPFDRWLWLFAFSRNRGDVLSGPARVWMSNFRGNSVPRRVTENSQIERQVQIKNLDSLTLVRRLLFRWAPQALWKIILIKWKVNVFFYVFLLTKLLPIH